MGDVVPRPNNLAPIGSFPIAYEIEPSALDKLHSKLDMARKTDEEAYYQRHPEHRPSAIDLTVVNQAPVGSLYMEDPTEASSSATMRKLKLKI